jgi:hypothetical protein
MRKNMDNIYEQSRACIDKFSVGFVAAPSVVELKILKRLFTGDEAAAIASRMGREPGK